MVDFPVRTYRTQTVRQHVFSQPSRQLSGSLSRTDEGLVPSGDDLVALNLIEDGQVRPVNPTFCIPCHRHSNPIQLNASIAIQEGIKMEVRRHLPSAAINTSFCILNWHPIRPHPTIVVIKLICPDSSFSPSAGMIRSDKGFQLDNQLWDDTFLHRGLAFQMMTLSSCL